MFLTPWCFSSVKDGTSKSKMMKTIFFSSIDCGRTCHVVKITTKNTFKHKCGRVGGRTHIVHGEHYQKLWANLAQDPTSSSYRTLTVTSSHQQVELVFRPFAVFSRLESNIITKWGPVLAGQPGMLYRVLPRSKICYILLSTTKNIFDIHIYIIYTYIYRS